MKANRYILKVSIDFLTDYNVASPDGRCILFIYLIVDIQLTPSFTGFFGTTTQKQVGTGKVTYPNGTAFNYMMWGADVATYGFAVATRSFEYLAGTKVDMEVISFCILVN